MNRRAKVGILYLSVQNNNLKQRTCYSKISIRLKSFALLVV